MAQNRERAVTDAFVSIANSLVGKFDVIDLLSGLAADCADLLDIASAGLLLADERRLLHVVAASSEATRMLELFQIQREQGPCLESFRTGQPVTVADLAEHRDRWPLFTEAARSSGFVSVHAFPMRLDADVLGTLGLFGTNTGELDEDDVRLAQALAHVASIALVNATAAADPSAIGDQLHSTLASRATIEQAKGFLSQVGGLDMPDAFDAMRRYAGENTLLLNDVATQLLQRSLDWSTVLGVIRP